MEPLFDAPAPTGLTPPTPAELAAAISAKLCHDMINSVSAIASGIDLLQDESSADMHDDAVEMIGNSAGKLADMLEFYRVAFGASASSEAFSVPDLRSLAERIFSHQRAELDWNVPFETLKKPAARALLNIAQIAGSAMPRGGTAVVTATNADGFLTLTGQASGRIIMKDEVTEGLSGRPLGEGLVGYWVQGYYLAGFVADAGGTLAFEKGEESFSLTVRLPA